MQEWKSFYCGNGCPLGGADDCFWWKGHESCEHYKSKKINLPENEADFQAELYKAYMAGAYTERTGTFRNWYNINYK